MVATAPGLLSALSSANSNGLSSDVMVGVNSEESFKSIPVTLLANCVNRLSTNVI